MKKLLLLTALALAGCSSTDVADPFSVAIQGYVTSSFYNSSTARYECRYVVSLISSGGRAKDYATFQGGTLFFMYDNLTESQVMSPDEVLNFWAKGRIGFEEQVEASRVASSGRKFRLRHVFNLRLADGTTIEKTADIGC